MTFRGFGEGAVDFFDGLAADNSRAYWTDHRLVYERDVRDPMLALLGELEPEFGPGKIFRPYRDVRFTADKSPYKTHCGATAGPFYVQVSSEGLLAAAGYWRMRPDQLARYRAAVDDDHKGPDLVDRIATLTAAGLDIGGDRLTGRPRGFGAEHPRLDLLRHKGLYAWCQWPPDAVLHERACLDRVVETWRTARPLVEWLDDHVGPSDAR